MRLRVRWIGAWVLYAGIVLLASLGQAQEQAEEPEARAQQEQEPAEALPLPFPVEIVESDARADARQRQEAEARQREIDDLVAQQGVNAATQAMNRATQRMAKYAFWSTVFVAIGTALVLASLRLMWQANRAAVAAVEVTRDIGQKQIRAYVIIWNIRAINFKMGERAKVIFDIDNRGQTPARILRLAVGTRTDSDPNNVKIKDIKTHEIPSVGVIGGQTKMPQPRSMPISGNDANAIAFFAGEKAYVMGGYLIYRDIFGKTRRTVFRCKLTLDQIEDGNGFFMLCARNNRFS